MSEIIIQYECSLILAVEYQKNKFLKGNYKLKKVYGRGGRGIASSNRVTLYDQTNVLITDSTKIHKALTSKA
jgi:hypothetical protein